MPELPEIYTLAAQMDKELRGKCVASVEVRQEKCLNVPLADFRRLVLRKTVGPVTARGKWVLMALEPKAHFLLSLGMGGDALYHAPGAAWPEKYQVAFAFDDGSAFTMAFWWFGYAHAVSTKGLAEHKMTATLGLSPLDDAGFTYEAFTRLLAGKKGALKPVLMDQKQLAGIGNVYIQDILFLSRLHPNRKIATLTEEERRQLYDTIRTNLRACTDLGGLAYEKDLYGRNGRFSEFLVGYREGKPCPECGTTIVKLRTGSTATFICPTCQPE